MSEIQTIFSLVSRILNLQLRAAGYTFTILNFVMFCAVFILVTWFICRFFLH